MTIASERDVARLEIAVKKPVAVRIVQRVGDRDAEPQHIVHRQRATFEARLECAATDVLHYQELAAIPDIEVEDGGDTRVREAGQHERLATESFSARRVAQGSVQEHLDGDIPVEVVVVGLPYLPHPALADALEESIPSEDGTGFVGRVLGGGLSETGCHGCSSGKGEAERERR